MSKAKIFKKIMITSKSNPSSFLQGTLLEEIIASVEIEVRLEKHFQINMRVEIMCTIIL